MEQLSINKDVLVIGGELTGAGTALTIADAGYNVIFAQKKSAGGNVPETLLGAGETAVKNWRKAAHNAFAHKNIEFLEDTRVLKTAGVAGDFCVRLEKSGKDPIEKKAGAIVVATDLTAHPLNETYGVAFSDKVLSLSDAEKKIADGGAKGASVGFVAGFADPGDPLAMRRIFELVPRIMDNGGSAAVYVNDIKLADAGLDRLYKIGRDKGAIYFKMKSAPDIKDTTLTFKDPVLNQPVETTHDLLVIDEDICPDSDNASLAGALGLHRTASGFLQKDNVHRFPVNSNRRGMFVTGMARDIKNLTECLTDISSVVLELETLFKELTEGPEPEKVAVVDREKCVTCLTCYRCCPHGAIYWDDKAVISPVACQGCGICASECPNDAIQVETHRDNDIVDRISAKLQETPNGVVAFCCENSAAEAAASAVQFGMTLPESLIMIDVPCAGKVDISYILAAFLEGAAGVLVAACHNGNCKSEYGSDYAKWRVNEVFRMLEETGVEKERLAFVTLASNMTADFAGAVKAMADQVTALA